MYHLGRHPIVQPMVMPPVQQIIEPSIMPPVQLDPELDIIQPGATVGATVTLELQNAWNYIVGKVRAFDALGSKLWAQRHEVSVVAGMARQRGDSEGHAQAVELVNSYSNLISEYDTAHDRLDAIRARVPGLSAVPVAIIAIAAAVIALSIAMGAVFLSSSEHERELVLLEEGVLTQEEIVELRAAGTAGFAGGLAGTAKWAALGVALFFGLPLLTRAFK